MNDFKLCPNGHYYPQHLAECQYCPKPTASGTPTASGLDKTKIDLGGDLDKTRIDTSSQPPAGGGSLSKTQIFTGDTPTPQTQEAGYGQQPRTSGRKLVGWLVSFTLDPNGADYRLYEGRNSLGSDPGCDIVVSGDPAVSSRHLTLLHRMGSFKFKDELSTNGTFINDTFNEEGNLNDGDIIRIGSTVFKFRTVA